MPRDDLGAPTLVPDTATIREFLRVFTEGAPPGALVEIAYNPGSDGQISRAQHFDPANIDDICKFAVGINTEPTNVYYGVAFRKPDCPVNKRTQKPHVLGTRWLWADFDNDADAAKARCAALDCMPTIGVLTGSIPHKRTQMLWRVDTLLTDVAEIEKALGALCSLLNGDRAVADAPRVMRLPGSISWPKANKPGRIAEVVKMSVLP